MSILDKLLIRGLKSSEDSCINCILLKSKVDAIAALSSQFFFLVDQRRQTFTSFNYNPDLFPLFGSNPYAIKTEKVHELITPHDHQLLLKYIQIINTHFINKNKQADRNVYFTIEHTFDVHKKPEGARLKVLPYLYDSQNNLIATLAIIEPIQFAGNAILRKHSISNNKIYVYTHSDKQFLQEKATLLSDIECKIIHLSGMGVKEKEIAETLNLTLAILKRIKTTIFEKLKVNSISEAIFIAYKRNYLNTSIDIHIERE